MRDKEMDCTQDSNPQEFSLMCGKQWSLNNLKARASVGDVLILHSVTQHK